MERLRQQVLRALRHGPATFWDLLPLQDGDLAGFVSVLQELLREGLIAGGPGGSLVLTPPGEETATPLLPLQNCLCRHCRGTGLAAPDFFAQVLTRWHDLAAHRPTPTRTFDQGHVTAVDTMGRVMFMYRRGDLEERRLFFLGDDDLTSLAAALTGLPQQITVLEIDQRLVNFLNDTAAQQGWRHFRAQVYDVQQPLPTACHENFDVAVTDPVETRQGFLLFLSRCAEALARVGGAVYFGLTRQETGLAKWHHWLETLLGMGFTLTDLLPAFHQYQQMDTAFVAEEYPHARQFLPELPPTNMWYVSSLVRLQALTRPRPLYHGAVALGERLYRD